RIPTPAWSDRAGDTTVICTRSLHDALPISFAKDRDQADRIIAYQFSRVRSMVAALLAQVDVARDAFGERTIPPAYQEDLFGAQRSEEHTSELQSRENLVCRLLLEKKKQVED